MGPEGHFSVDCCSGKWFCWLCFVNTLSLSDIPHLVSPHWLLFHNPLSFPWTAHLQTHTFLISSIEAERLSMMKGSWSSSYREFPPCLQLQSCPWGRWSSTWWFPSGGPPRCLRDPLQGRHKINHHQLQRTCHSGFTNVSLHRQYN